MKDKNINIYCDTKAKAITVFFDTMESQDRKVRELEAQGYKVVPVKDRKLGEGVTLVLE